MWLLIKARYVLTPVAICLGAFGITALIAIAVFCRLLIFLFELLGDE